MDNVEMVGDGVGFNEPPSTQFSSRTLEVDQQDGADAYELELDEDAAVIESESVSNVYVGKHSTADELTTAAAAHEKCILCS